MRTWVFRIVIPSGEVVDLLLQARYGLSSQHTVGGIIIIIFVAVLIISVVIYSITKQGRKRTERMQPITHGNVIVV